MSRISQKQRAELEAVRYYARIGCHPTDTPRPLIITASAEGLSADEAYFAVTARGEPRVATTDPQGLRQLLWGQRWLNMHISMFRRDLRDGLITVDELVNTFKDVPQVRDFVFKSLGRPVPRYLPTV